MLGANGRHSDLLSKTLGGAAAQAAYFTVQSDQPVALSALTGSNDLSVLSALEAQPVAMDASSGPQVQSTPGNSTMAGLAGIRPAGKPQAIDVSPSLARFWRRPSGADQGPFRPGPQHRRSAPRCDRNRHRKRGLPGGLAVRTVQRPTRSRAIGGRPLQSAGGRRSERHFADRKQRSRAPFGPVALSGTGSGEAVSGAAIRIAPGSLDFGTVGIGESKSLPVTVRNAGDAPLDVLSGTSSNSVFSASFARFTLAPGVSRDILVTFTPNAIGAQIGRITIYSGDRANPSVDVTLSGTGQKIVSSGVKIQLGPPRLDFGDVITGQSKEMNIAVTGTWRDTPLTVRGVTSDNPRFQYVGPAMPFTPGFSGVVNLPVRFTPDSAGPQSGTLTITSNAENAPSVTIPVAGNGISTAQRTVELQVDDGTFETPANYIYTPGDAYYMNRLTPPVYPATLKSVRIYFHDLSDGIPPDTGIAIFSAASPLGKATIDGLLFTRTAAKVLKLGEFNEYVVPEVTITSGDFVVGFTVSKTAEMKPAAADTSSPSRQRSFFSTNGVNFKLTDDSSLGDAATLEFGRWWWRGFHSLGIHRPAAEGLEAAAGLPQQGQKLVPGLLTLAEAAQHGAGHCPGVLLFHAAHHHAEVAGLADNADAFGVQNSLNRLGDLLRQPLLHLQPAGKHVDDPGNLTQADYLVLGQVGHVHLAVEGQQMVFAHAEELDVLDDHHLVVLNGEQRPVDDFVQIHGVAAGQKAERFLGAHRGPNQSLPGRIFPQFAQDPLHRPGDLSIAPLGRHHFHYRFFSLHLDNSTVLFFVSRTRTVSSAGP